MHIYSKHIKKQLNAIIIKYIHIMYIVIYININALRFYMCKTSKIKLMSILNIVTIFIT